MRVFSALLTLALILGMTSGTALTKQTDSNYIAVLDVCCVDHEDYSYEIETNIGYILVEEAIDVGFYKAKMHNDVLLESEELSSIKAEVLKIEDNLIVVSTEDGKKVFDLSENVIFIEKDGDYYKIGKETKIKTNCTISLFTDEINGEKVIVGIMY